jgi:hypothetical protein
MASLYSLKGVCIPHNVISKTFRKLQQLQNSAVQEWTREVTVYCLRQALSFFKNTGALSTTIFFGRRPHHLLFQDFQDVLIIKLVSF